jgi:antitoxin HigA-1
MKSSKTQSLGTGPKIHPGVILQQHILQPRGITQTAFAKATGLPVSRISEIIAGKRGVTVDAAIRFALVLDTTDTYWLNIQANYDRCCAHEEKGADYKQLRPLLGK